MRIYIQTSNWLRLRINVMVYQFNFSADIVYSNLFVLCNVDDDRSFNHMVRQFLGALTITSDVVNYYY